MSLVGLTVTCLMGGLINCFKIYSCCSSNPSLLDGHSSHYNPAVIKQIKNIVILCLPPNTTHIMQPLDRVCFGAVKQFWNEEFHSYMQQHPGKVIRRGQFCQVFRLAWMRRMIMKNIFASFKTTGIQPFNKLAIALPGECTLPQTRNNQQRENQLDTFPSLLKIQ